MCRLVEHRCKCCSVTGGERQQEGLPGRSGFGERSLDVLALLCGRGFVGHRKTIAADARGDGRAVVAG
jgi:hypothetical protein